MRIKAGVIVNGVQPEAIVGMLICEQLFRDRGLEMTVTSLTDGKAWRSPRSLHLQGLAFDVRIWDLPTLSVQESMAADMRSALGDEYDVVLKSDHIHIEFDPK